MLAKIRSQNGLLRSLPAERAGVRPLFPILCLVSLALLALSRIDHGIVRDLRWQVTEAMTPMLQALSIPVEPLRWAKHRVTDMTQLSEEVSRLRAENLKLKGYEWRAKELARTLKQLQPLARMVAETPYNFVTTRVMSNSSGAFVRSVLVDVGRKQALRPGYPVVNELGLVGRVVDAGESAARILLLTDLNSRVPVRVGGKGVRAILVGDNGARPRLDFVAANSDIKPGDEIATSGSGGLFPQGLRVGRLMRDRRGLRVELSANLDQLEYVSVLFYNGPTLEMTDKSAKRKDARLVGQKKFKLDAKR
jgi:rod shape-determining protein MreC